MIEQSSPAETHLIAGPPPANPPLAVAFLIVVLSLVAPFLFLRAGQPSLWLTSAILALAFAGLVSFAGAVDAQRKRRADNAVRTRATITPEGIKFLPTPTRPTSRDFAARDLKTVHLLQTALIVHTNERHAAPGRHVLRFGRLACPREKLLEAIQALMSSDRT